MTAATGPVVPDKKMAIPWQLTRFSRYLWLTLGMFAAFATTFGLYALSEKRVDRANESRHRSYLLADELRQSSDDLTRMVRTYVVTGAPIYKQHYQEILDIRDGKKPRPADYDDIYWDLVLADNLRPRPPGAAVPLLELLRSAGFTEVEFARLAQAKANSDALTNLEFAAMALIESANPPTGARAEAIRMLHDAAYHQGKARIMRPISEFQRIAGERTREAVHVAQGHATRMRVAFVLFGLLLVSLLWSTRRSLHAILGGSVNELYTRIAYLGGGNFSSVISVAKGMENSVLGWLSETQINLARMDTQRRQAEEEVGMRTKELNESVLASLNMMEDAVRQREIAEQAYVKLEQTHVQLLEASRQAGMAEVATGVLHNVGNVLNSVNVSATLVVDSVSNSRAASLAKVVALLREHEADLGGFLTSDPKGQADCRRSWNSSPRIGSRRTADGGERTGVAARRTSSTSRTSWRCSRATPRSRASAKSSMSATWSRTPAHERGRADRATRCGSCATSRRCRRSAWRSTRCCRSWSTSSATPSTPATTLETQTSA